jgi:large subunit ribosomal protein L17
MANSVIEKEQIITTVQKAKEVRRVVDRLITLGKAGSDHSRRLAFDRTRDADVVKKLFTALAERYKERKGGYTRVLKISDRRWGDSAEMAVLELVDHPELDRKKKAKAPASMEGAETAEVQDKAPRDPFKGFRKMFAGNSKVKKAGPAKSAKAQSGASARKSPAGGGSSKAGGSS